MEINPTLSNNPMPMINPVTITIVVLIVLAYIAFFSSLGNNAVGLDGEYSTSKKILLFIVVAILIILIVINAFKYFFSVDIVAYMKDIFSNKPKIEIVVDQSYEPAPVPTIRWKKQVFNVPGNYYDYENAKALCKAYGAELANYKQLEEAYESGAEWCNYGWSDKQMVLFPTQQKTFDKLQKIAGHENDCGRPGVNGGYIANPNARFGVNCYGNKPKIRPEERELMDNTPAYPVTMKDIVFDKRVDFWKNHVDDILVSPFNKYTWGEL